MSNNRFGDWAQRNASRGGGPPAAQPPAAAPAQALSQLPPGYVWVFQQGLGYVAMPLAALPTQPAPAPQPVPPQYQPQPQYAQPQAPVVSYVPQPMAAPPMHQAPAPAVMMAPMQSCALVKGDGKDPYADLMSGVRDLVPPSAYDANQGRPSPETLAAVSGTPEFMMAMSQPQTPFAASSAPRSRGAELGSVPVPDPTPPQPVAAAAQPVMAMPPPMMPQLDGPITPAGTRPMN
jgi:hypothetical protein